jgi:hypothetical protein
MPKHLMCHDVQIPHSEDDNPKRRVSVTVSKLPEPKRDNGCHRQTATRHRIPPVKRMYRRGNRETPPERVRLSRLLSRFSIQMNQRSSPWQRRTPIGRTPMEILSIRNGSGDSVNSTKRRECLAENYCRNSVDLTQYGSHK